MASLRRGSGAQCTNILWARLAASVTHSVLSLMLSLCGRPSTAKSSHRVSCDNRFPSFFSEFSQILLRVLSSVIRGIDTF